MSKALRKNLHLLKTLNICVQNRTEMRTKHTIFYSNHEIPLCRMVTVPQGTILDPQDPRFDLFQRYCSIVTCDLSLGILLW